MLAFKLTPGNVDDRKPVPEMTEGIFCKLFGALRSGSLRDRGYISQDLFEKLYEQQLKLITRYKKKMKQKLVKLIDKILLRKRALIETVNDQLKNILQIEHSRHRSVWNFLVNLIAGLIAYTYLPHKAIQRVGRVPRLEATESRHPLLIWSQKLYLLCLLLFFNFVELTLI